MNSEPKPSRDSELVWQYFARKREGFFIEVGAYEPKHGSQTWLLEHNGWQGILVEPRQALTGKLRAERPRSRVFPVACGAPGHPEQMPFYVADVPSKSSLAKYRSGITTKYPETEMVKIMTLDAILAEAGNPKVDFISIDVEGTQLDVLRGFSITRHRPGLLFVEDHLHDFETHRFVTAQGYRLVKRTGSNNWYVPRETRFEMTTALEKIRLWKKLWLNTPFRKLRVSLERKRAGVE